MAKNKLEKNDISSLFDRLDQAAEKLGYSDLVFFIIGGTVLIQEGMPKRSTMDIDFWKVDLKQRKILSEMAALAGIDFDPDDYADRENPYIQTVWPEFVHMPAKDSWMKDSETLWRGKNIQIQRPPIGVLLGSKLAAGRDQDLLDAAYVVQTHPEWKDQLNMWASDFSEEHQELIEENLIFVELISSDKNRKNKP